MPKIGFIGAGPVGIAFGVRLSQLGYEVTAVSDISSAAAQKFANAIPGCQIYEKAQDLADNTDFVFLTIPNDDIPEVAAQLKWHPGQSAIHCSGATSVVALEPAKQQGAIVGSIHPLQTFASLEQGIENLPGSTFGIEAEEPLRSTLKDMVVALNGDWVFLTAEEKALYHAAAVIACNYFYTITKVASNLWQNFGKSTTEAIKAYLPLMRGAMNNMENLGFPGCLTGPVAVGDLNTIRKHLNALEKYAPSTIPIYKALGRETIPIALDKGIVNESRAEELRTLLK
ncbi:Rossmann-like and DUF2520 domain-containing protein [Chloroflexota bacterium]